MAERETLAQKMEAQGYLTVASASQMMGRSVYTIYRWIKAGTLDGEKVLGHWFVTHASMVAKANEDDTNGARKLGLISDDSEEQPHAVESAQPQHHS